MDNTLEDLIKRLSNTPTRVQQGSTQTDGYIASVDGAEQDVNDVITLKINNPIGAPVNQLVVGSLLGIANGYKLVDGQVPSACDSGLITDQSGNVGVPFVQGFSQMVNIEDVFIYDLKIKTVAENSSQLNVNGLIKTIRFDSSVRTDKVPVIYTAEMTDQRKDMVNYRGVFRLNNRKALVIPITNNVTQGGLPVENNFDVMFKIMFVANGKIFTRLK